MAQRNGHDVVVVESPAKARTIANILGRQYKVLASLGHVRDLPKRELGVDIEAGFQPRYVVIRDKEKAIRQIREAAQQAGTVYLATDPDREGEAIAWHLLHAAGLLGRPYRRVVFHEITPQAVREAFRNPRDIDMRLVEAQQARRVLDRLLGYKLSPFLWRKVKRGLSAGRVQSVALRLLVEREREIESFVPREYWTIEALLAKDGASFTARLVGYLGRRQKLEIPNEAEAQRLVALLRSSHYRVEAVERKEQARRPPPPFITSTLQQEAARRLGFSAQKTMVIAQQLYEGVRLGAQGEVGLITYMRTDSTHLAETALEEVRDYIRQQIGAEFLPRAPRQYKTKVKNAQEAHEAIRPTSVRRDPESLRPYLTDDQLKLYTLIWQRTLACQIADARYEARSVEIAARPSSGEPLLLRASSSVLLFPGYRQLYIEGSDDEEDQDGAGAIPELSPGDVLALLDLTPRQHFTEPPRRYSEASLIKALEEKGIGRPSTYAVIIATLLERGYVEREGRQLRPTDLGRLVNDLLVQHFPEFVDVDFTAEMEDRLDEIARGERPWQPVVREFYAPLEQALARAEKAPKATEATDQTCEVCGHPMVIRWGRRGRFLSCSGFPECRNARPLEGEEPPQPAEEACPECGAAMVVKRSRYGPFLACSRYPACRGRRPYLVSTGAACPKCGGDLVERRSRRGRPFYGCSRYPQCDFVVWRRPLATPCPQCRGLLVADGREGARCTACSWRGAAPVAP
ncbi:MAG TPA: type I DNA topoisomerase [Dehalococcoidia bacterium]|nr:type I DNA topoisomerase [Dehalococcoidia bacterium]